MRSLTFVQPRVTEIGTFMHAVEGEMLCASTLPSKVRPSVRLVIRSSGFSCIKCTQVPYFNAPIYLPTKAPIGKVDEILGPISALFSPACVSLTRAVLTSADPVLAPASSSSTHSSADRLTASTAAPSPAAASTPPRA